MCQCYVICLSWNFFLNFEKYDTLWPLTPLGGVVWQGHCWLFWSFDYCLQDDIVSFHFVAIFIFFMWMTFFIFWPQWPHRDLEPHHCLCMSSGQDTGHFDQVNIKKIKSDVGKYAKKTCCQKKETSRKQKPARLHRQAKNSKFPSKSEEIVHFC